MVQTLKPDDTKEEVRCPHCDHKWWTSLELPVAARGKTIHCPKCQAPLRPPILSLPLTAEEEAMIKGTIFDPSRGKS